MKKSILKFSVFIVYILIVSQIAFAESADRNFNSEAGYYEKDGTSREFEDDFRVENIENKEMPGGEGRENQRTAAKRIFENNGQGTNYEKDGRFNDEEYQFEEKGYYSNRPDFGPSFEGFNKDEMLFGRLFMHIDGEMSEEGLMQQCANPEKIADIVIEKVKAKIGEISNVCKDMEEEELKCKEEVESHCTMFGQPDTSYAIDELHKLEILSGSCPLNKEAIIDACILRSKQNADDRLEYAEKNCKNQWNSYEKQNSEQCERSQESMICDENKYIESCLDKYGVNEDDFEETCPDLSSIQKPYCENGYLKEKRNDNNCITGYECFYEQKQCSLTEEEAERISSECIGRNGKPERIYQNECLAEVKCHEFQCPYTEAQADQKESECVSLNMRFEERREGDCIVEINCYPNEEGMTGNTVAFNSYEDYKRKCEDEWNYQKQSCTKMTQCPEEDSYIQECIASDRKNIENDMANAKMHCDVNSMVQIKHMERQCARMDAERQRCSNEGSSRCQAMQGLASECKSKVTEENFRNFIVREAEKRCKFIPYMKKEIDFSGYKKIGIVLAVMDSASEEDISKIKSVVEDLEKKYELDGKIIYEGMIGPSNFGELKNLDYIIDAKLNAPESSETSKERKGSIISRLDPGKVVEKLLELTGSDVSGEYKYIIEDKANDILEASETIEGVKESEESKGFGYKLKLFLGFAKEAEENEIKSLELSKERLEISIKSLGKLAEEIQDEISRAILKEQVAELERQKEDISSLIAQKDKKAKGLLRLFGLFG